MDRQLSVILIAHNEEQLIGGMIHGLFARYDQEIFEVLVVDDASTDQTASLVEGFMRSYPKLKLVKKDPPCGVGRALKTGFKHASSQADYILTTDSDFVDNIGEVRSMIDAIEEGYDGAIGSRFIQGSRLSRYPFEKRIANRFFHFIVRKLFHIQQEDLTNNLKLYKRNIFKSLPWKSNNFGMNAETGILPIVASYRIKEVPVSWTGRKRGMGKSKFAILKHGWEYAKVIAYVWEFVNARKPQPSI